MSLEDGSLASSRAASWARTLNGLRNTQLQVSWLRERLSRESPAGAADVLSIVLARAEQREGPYTSLLLLSSLALADQGAFRRAIARVADSQGQAALARFLGGRPAASEPAEARQDTQQLADVRTGRPLLLGERKSMARKLDRAVLAKVLSDPHPDVIRILLDNPVLREADVVRLCARRPIHQAVLGEVFKHPRWIMRYHVRRALVLNPNTPEDLAIQLVVHLAPRDRREVAQSRTLPTAVRDACREPTHPTQH